jgi:DNA-binding transcriptional MerR regulator
MTEAGFTIAEVASMVGLTPYTIRAWEKRYGALKPRRTPADHRRYTMEDVELLRRVKQEVSLKRLTLKLAVMRARGEILEPEIEEVKSTSAPRAADDQPDEQAPWRAMADLSPLLMAVLTTEGRIVDANIAFARAAGVMRGSLRGARFADFVDPHDRAKAVKAYRPPLRQRRGWELNLRTKMVSGMYSFDCWPLRRGERWLLGLIGRDLSASGMDMWAPEGE